MKVFQINVKGKKYEYSILCLKQPVASTLGDLKPLASMGTKLVNIYPDTDIYLYLNKNTLKVVMHPFNHNTWEEEYWIWVGCQPSSLHNEFQDSQGIHKKIWSPKHLKNKKLKNANIVVLIILMYFLLGFRDIFSCSLGWPELPILQPPPPKCQDFRPYHHRGLCIHFYLNKMFP